MLLILTSDKDLTADFLIVELIDRNMPYFRLNAEELMTANRHLARNLQVAKSLDRQHSDALRVPADAPASRGA